MWKKDRGGTTLANQRKNLRKDLTLRNKSRIKKDKTELIRKIVCRNKREKRVTILQRMFRKLRNVGFKG